MTLASGSRLGPYEILSPLGVGGMGEVWKARDPRLGRDVAIKVLPASFSADADRLRRFEQEARAAGILNHPNITAVHDIGSHEGAPYVVSELLEGETLRSALSGGKLSQRKAIDYALQIAQGLAAAHEKGIVHRDLKPENLFVIKDGRVKILDFGLAKLVRPEAVGTESSRAPTLTAGTEPGVIMGTVGYMSPEQVRGRPADARSDIFSFGAILYEMLTGQRAFRGDSTVETMNAILKEEPPDLSESGRNVSLALDHIVRHCLEKDRDNRFQTAKDVAFALSEAAAPVSVSTRTESITPSGRKSSRIATAVAVGLVLVAISIVFFLRRPASTQAKAAPSIAVLPFTNMSPDKDQEYFSDGLSEELLGLLAKVPELHVAGRTSSFAFKGKNEDLRGIGQKLSVTTVLEGSVRKSGDRLRISAQLVNVADGFELWSETYDRKLTDVFAVQDDIAGAVVDALKLKLLPRQRPSTAGRRTANPEAYSQYLLGRQFLNRGTAEGFRLAVSSYEKAVALDPNFAPAFAGLAMAGHYAAGYDETAASMAEGLRKALAAADKAISLDPELAEAYVARGRLRSARYWDWSGAQKDLKRALVLDPGDADALSNLGLLLACLGRLPEAIAAEKKALDLDPLSARAWNSLGYFYNASGQTAAARQALQRALEINPGFGFAPFHLGVASLLDRDPKAALAEFERTPNGIFRLVGLAIAQQELGLLEESRQALNTLIEKNSAYQIAEVYAWRGDRDKAFEWFDRAYAQNNAALSHLKFDPLVAGLRGDPRYEAMLKKLSLPVGK